LFSSVFVIITVKLVPTIKNKGEKEGRQEQEPKKGRGGEGTHCLTFPNNSSTLALQQYRYDIRYRE
jgi:hypothetical protein